MTAALAERYRTAAGHTVVVALDAAGGWWDWTLYAGNGAELSRSALTYSRKDAALRSARRLHPPQLRSCPP